MNIIIQPPHKKSSSKVTESQIKDIVIPLIPAMTRICNTPFGKHRGALALAHCQIEKDTPLRFFVFASGRAIVNPKVLAQENKVQSLEGCYSFPYRDRKKVSRYNNIKVNYTEIEQQLQKVKTPEGKIEDKWVWATRTIEGGELEGEIAFVFQHEINHFNGITIY